tara:strand:- start:4745 stop:6289 length:1545 start_codon:yes stop_codon:yes gene_type:complete
MTKFSKYKHSYIVIIFFTIIHLIFAGLWPVNFEFTFSEAAKYLKNFDIRYIDFYISNNANTLAFPIIVGVIHKVIPFDTLVIAKIISASSYLIMGVAVINFYKKLNFTKDVAYCLIFIYLNPIVWVLGFRGTPDLFSSSLALLAASLLIQQNLFNLKRFFYLILFSSAILIKPITAIFSILIFYFKFLDNNFKFNLYYIRSSVGEILIIITPTILYLIFFIQFFSNENTINYVDIINEKFGRGFYNNFFLYLGFIFLSISILLFSKKKYIFIFIFLSSIILLSSIYFDNSFDKDNDGEMNFGFLSTSIPNNLYYIYMIFLGVLMLSIFIFLCVFIFRKSDIDFNKAFPFLLCFIVCVVILSLFRPVQRYLILILPISILFVSEFRKKNIFISISYICFFSLINILIINNQITNSLISKKVYNYLYEKKILSDTYPGELNPHIRHLFVDEGKIAPATFQNEDRDYIIQATRNNSTIKSFSASFIPFIKKTLHVNKCDIVRLNIREGIACKQQSMN